MKIIKTINYKAGYKIQHELIDGIILKSAYTPDGKYIGSSRDAHFLCKTEGITPETIDKTKGVCTIGFSERQKKWFGWSHRAIFGFGIGDEVKEGDSANKSEFSRKYRKEHPEEDKRLPVGFKAKTLEDCKKMAIAFAESVS